jgi:N-acyl homoserine lactone hydrolase
MHNDHCGCVEYFGKSTIIVHQDEFSAAARAFASNDNSGPYIRKDTAAWIAANLTWRQIGSWEGDLDLVDGVRILNFGAGHAYGMLGLHVALRGHGSVILASDALYCADNFYPKFVPSGVMIDSAGAARTARRIHNLAISTKSEVWFGHDMDQFSKLIHSTEGFYE